VYPCLWIDYDTHLVHAGLSKVPDGHHQLFPRVQLGFEAFLVSLSPGLGLGLGGRRGDGGGWGGGGRRGRGRGSTDHRHRPGDIAWRVDGRDRRTGRRILLDLHALERIEGEIHTVKYFLPKNVCVFDIIMIISEH
jgi:hypothetical protein